MDLLRWLAVPGIQLGSLLSEGWDAYRGASTWSEVPPLEPSLGTALGAMLDRAFTVGTSLLTGVPSPEVVRRFNREATAMREFLANGGWLVDPAAYHQAPPAVEEWGRASKTTWLGASRSRYEHVTWESGFSPRPDEPGREAWLAHEGNRTLHAYVLEHADRPRPWLVCVHGFGMGTPLVNFSAFSARQLHEELGLNLVFPSLPFHGPRGAGRLSGSELVEPDYLNLMHAVAQGAWDVRRTLAWVRARGAEQVGLYGISLGGYVSALVASLEDGLDCVITVIPMVDLVSAARDNEPWIFRRYEQEFEIDWEAVRALTHVVSPLSIAPRVPTERAFICAGLADRVVRPQHARALWRHWGHPEIHWFAGSHVLGMFDASVPAFVASSLRAVGLA